MPQIKEYQSRTEVGSEVAARRVTGDELGNARQNFDLGNTLQASGEVVYKRIQQDETSNASVRLSEAHAQLTNELNDQIQKGTLDTEKFSQTVDDTLSKIGDDATTGGAKNFVQKSAAQLKAHFLESSFAGQSELAGVKSRANYEKTLANYSSSLMNDPSSYQTVKDVHDSYVDNLVKEGSLPATVAEQLKVKGGVDLSKAAVRGWVQLDPEDAKKQLQSGQWDSAFDGDVKKQMLGEADMGIRARDIEADRRRQVEEEAVKAKQKVVQNDFLAKMVDNSLSAKDILNSPLEAFGSGSKEQFLQLMKTSQEKGIQTDPAVFTDLFRRIHLPDGDPNKLVDENALNSYLGNGLNLPDIKHLRDELQGSGTEAGKYESELKSRIMDMAKSKLSKSNPMLGIRDANGDESLAKFQSFFMQEYQAQRQAGKSSKDLLDPDAPDYLGKYVGNYAKTPQQIMRDNVKSMGPQDLVPLPNRAPVGTKPRKPGETIQQWLERTKDK